MFTVVGGAFLQFLLELSVFGSGQECGESVLVGDDLIGDTAARDLAGPTDDTGHPIAALPVGVLFAPKWDHAAVRPREQLCTVVGGVHDDGVVGDAELIENLSHVSVVLDHPIAVDSLPVTPLDSFFKWVQMCMRDGVNHKKGGLVGLMGELDKV